MAAEHLLAIKELQAEANASFDPIIQAAHQTHKEALAQKKRICDPLLGAEELLKCGMKNFLRLQEKLRREEEERQRAEAERYAAEQREREIEAAEAAGASVEEIEVLAEAPLERRPVVVAPQVRPVSGISMREAWKAEVTDLPALIKYVASRPEFANLLTPNMPAINALARSMRSAMTVPGIKVWNESNIAARRTS
jgi:hypothetical protein